MDMDKPKIKFHPKKKEAIDRLADSLLEIRRVKDSQGKREEKLSVLSKLAKEILKTSNFADFIAEAAVDQSHLMWMIRKVLHKLDVQFSDWFIADIQDKICEVAVVIPIIGLSCLGEIEILGEKITNLDNHLNDYEHKGEDGLVPQWISDQNNVASCRIHVIAEPHKATQLAREKASYICSLLRFFDSSSISSTQPLICHPGSCNTYGNVSMLAITQQTSYLFADHQENHCIVAPEMVPYFNKLGLKKLEELYSQKDDSSLNSFLRKGFLKFSDSLQHEDAYERLVGIVSSLELLLVADQNQPLKKTLSESMALLLEQEYKRRKEIHDLCSRIYDCRSAYIHHGSKKLDLPDFAKFIECSRLLITTILNLKYKFDSKADLVKYIEMLKFS